MNYQDLVGSIRDNLAQYRYTEPLETLSVDGADGIVLATPRRRILMVRYLCGVLAVPDGYDTPEQARNLFETIRSQLTRKYARFPYWKELGTYLVLLSSNKLFLALQDRTGKFKDKTGFHMNVMLGTIFINRENYVNSAEATWGLFYSGRHFGAIAATVNEWCKRMRSEQGAPADADKPRR
jgi:hypothetical protein